MNTKRIAAAAEVIHAAEKKSTVPVTLAIALDAAGLLQSPETAAELVALRARVAELEYTDGDGRTYPRALPWASLMGHEDLMDFLDDLALSAAGGPRNPHALTEVERTCGTWRVIAEAQHAHNTAPGPDPVEDPHDSPLHHTYAKARQLEDQ